jgi:hypothetical protein
MKNLKNLIGDKYFVFIQFIKDSLNNDWFLEQENKVSTTKFLDTLKKLKIQSINHSFIRLGPDSDGGYLVPNALENIKYSFSPGVDYTIGFDAHCKKKGIKVFLLDILQNKDLINEIEKDYDLTNKFLGTSNNDNTITLESWVKSKEQTILEDRNLMLQCDIEGSEYISILATPKETLKRFKILVFELHYLNLLKNRIFNDLFNSFIDKILEDFVLIHLHPNNGRSAVKIDSVLVPKFVEATFMRKDDLELTFTKPVMPHPLDKDNLSYRKSIKLDPIFF